MSPKEGVLLLLLLGVGIVGVLAYTDVYPPDLGRDRVSGAGSDEITEETLFEDTALDETVPTPPERSVGSPEGFPPGLTRDRVVNPFVLGRAHREALLGAGSWTQHTRTVVFLNATASVSATETAMVIDGGDVAVGSFAATDQNRTEFDLFGPDTEFWVNETAAYVRFTESNRTSAIERDERYPVPFEVGSTEWRTIYRLFGQTNTSFEGVVERREEIFYRVVATKAWYNESPYGDIRDLTITALVSPDGFVREYVATFVRPAWGQETRVVVHVEYSTVGTTTVDRPDWLPTGSANVTEAPNTASGATVQSVGTLSSADGSAQSSPWPTTGRRGHLLAVDPPGIEG
ncbi:MAG: hypothetical protein ACI9YT_002016 [Halobacteriales archaeon]|jgi:hypothetical protein